MIYLQETPMPEMNATLRLTFLIIVFASIAFVVLYRFYVYFEQLYASKYKTPIFSNIILNKKDLSKDEIAILTREFNFYNSLNVKEQAIFRHRLSKFINRKTFIGREGVTPTKEKSC